MSISCECEAWGDGICAVGDPKEVTCRTPTKCHACGADIEVGQKKYMWAMYDWSECQTASPSWLCEECGDMACNLLELGYCFSLSESIKQQWLNYKAEHGIK